MGVDQSTPEQPIYSQPQPICATEPRFCLTHNVQLHLNEKLFSAFSENFKVTDAHNKDIIYFQCEGRGFSLSEKKILRDDVGVPVLNIKGKMFSLVDNKFNIYAGEGSERQICKFDSQTTFLKAKLSTVFCDVLNEGIQRHLVLKGDWWSKKYSIYLGEPKQGGIPVARIFDRSFIAGVADFIIEIAANVDIAICVSMCIALDEHGRER